MTIAIVPKKNLTKSGAHMSVALDSVVCYNASGVLSYSIDSVGTSDNTVCEFSSLANGADISYTTLYAAAHAVDSVRFP